MIFLANIAKRVWICAWAIAATSIVFLPVTVSSFFSTTGTVGFYLTRFWAWMMLTATATKLSIRGKDNIRKNQSYIIIANHQSNFDALAAVLSLGIPFRWVAKKELLKVPLFGQALRATGAVFIDRSDRQKAIESIHRSIQRLPPGVGLFFFAEGSRSVDGRIRPFKKGGFVTAIETGWPILPITINGSRKVLPKGSLAFQSGTIEVVVGEPIDTRNYGPDALEKLICNTREAIISKSSELKVPLSERTAT
jgi:1-acyl-sn-glycerol-3-phosphate acyltransferase